MQPLLSVVMPSLNQAAFIEASIRSVLDQDYRNLELIVADGGSTDGTQSILERLAAQDARLCWTSEQDSGPAAALNKALRKVRGTLIGWLNADDLYAPGAIARAVAAFDAHPDWLMVYGHAEHIDIAGRVLEPYPTLLPSEPIARFAQGCFICQPTVFFKRTLQVLLGELDESLKCSFDFDYWLRAFKTLPGRIGFADALQAQSRLHEGCITLRQRRRVMLEGLSVLHRHLGEAPAAWVRTYVNELVSGKAAAEDGKTMRDAALDLLDAATEFLAVQDEALLRQEILNDSRLGTPGGALSPILREPHWPRQSNCFAPAWLGKRFSSAISLGSWCHPARVLRDLEYRAFSGPFDWLFSSPEMVAHVLQDDFGLFLDQDQYEPVPEGARIVKEANLCDHRYYREHFGLRFVFNHHSPDRADDYAHYERSVRNFRAALKERAPPLLVLVTQRELVPGKFAPLLAAIDAHCSDYGLVLIRFVVREPENGEHVNAVHEDERVLALELCVAGPSNGMIFEAESDNVRFADLLGSFNVETHPRPAVPAG